jgi:hypothetical protein
MSYIVKNCPAKYFAGATNMKCSELGGDCDTKTDCVMKQIVELCKKQHNTCIFAVAFLADRILQLLDIEEVE